MPAAVQMRWRKAGMMIGCTALRSAARLNAGGCGRDAPVPACRNTLLGSRSAAARLLQEPPRLPPPYKQHEGGHDATLPHILGKKTSHYVGYVETYQTPQYQRTGAGHSPDPTAAQLGDAVHYLPCRKCRMVQLCHCNYIVY